MRNRSESDGISVQIVAGTHVVLLGMNATDTARQGLLGFAIRRVDHEENEDYWLFGSKVFEAVTPNPSPHDPPVSTIDHPIQSFLWGDYTAKPGYRYTYVIRPMYGAPEALVPGNDVTIDITTEVEDDGEQAVYFNRGAITSQAYSRKFGSSKPPEPDNPNHPQTAWLSRGLLEATIGFIDRVEPGEKIRCAAYEFQFAPVIEAFMRAHDRGVDVKISYEAGQKKEKGVLKDTSTTKSNRKAIDRLHVPNAILIKRVNRNNIPHNKFIIRIKNDVPIEVWTGSTNFTRSGFLGQSNVGHIIRNPDITALYLGYWEQLSQDPQRAPLRKWNIENTPYPEEVLPTGDTAFFSPRPKSRMLKWYGRRIAEAEQTVMFTAAFGVNAKLVPYFAEDKDFLRFLLTEKRLSPVAKEAFDRDRDILISKGSTLGRNAIQHKIPGWELDQWFLDEEHYRGTRGHIFYIHTKYCLIDPLTDDPILFSGSANFSTNSLLSNDENMLLIRGNTRVADIYLGEFDRLFRHFWFRQFANRFAGNTASSKKAKFLEDSDKWTDPHYKVGNFKERRRKLFG